MNKKELRDAVDNAPVIKYSKDGWHGEPLIERNRVREYVEMLDEPETLSPEWIKEHKVTRIKNLSKMTTDDVVPVEYLQNLLVPKQETPINKSKEEMIKEYGMSQNDWDELIERYKWHLEHEGYTVSKKPVVPEFVGEYLESRKGHNLVNIFRWLGDGDYTDRDTKTSRWLYSDIDNNSKLLAEAHLAYPNIEIEEEPKYYVLDKDGYVLIRKYSGGVGRVRVLMEPEDYYEWVKNKTKLTEKEIKDYDERYWAFREPVETVEENAE